jgi:glutamine amidotransferase
MCRLFGFRSHEELPVDAPLLREHNSLKLQSMKHPDGWGIAYFDQAHTPAVAHGLDPAHQSTDFERICGQVSSKAVVAHIRLASVGSVELSNAHPFLHKQWVFAHNGTVRDFAQHQAEIEAEIAPHFLPLIRGATDSERCFYLLLTRLQHEGALEGTPHLDAVARALGWTMRRVVEITEKPTPDKPPTALNFLLTDGKLMMASRLHRTLFFSDGTPAKAQGAHLAPMPGAPLRQFVIASEELSPSARWHEVAPWEIVGVDAGLHFHRWQISDLLR